MVEILDKIAMGDSNKMGQVGLESNRSNWIEFISIAPNWPQLAPVGQIGPD